MRGVYGGMGTRLPGAFEADQGEGSQLGPTV